jgi:hypothetical protein
VYNTLFLAVIGKKIPKNTAFSVEVCRYRQENAFFIVNLCFLCRQAFTRCIDSYWAFLIKTTTLLFKKRQLFVKIAILAIVKPKARQL